MAQYVDYFDYPVGSGAPTGYVILDTVTTAQIMENVTVDSYGGRFLRITRTTSNGDMCIVWDAIGSQSGDVEILARLRLGTTFQSGSTLGLWIHRTNSSTQSGYPVGHSGTPTSRTSIIRRANNGSFSVLAQQSTSTLAVGTWMWMRAQREGTNLRLKTWTGNLSAEPGSWEVTASDNTWSSGMVGFGTYRQSNNANFDLDVLAVGTNGDPAVAFPVPTIENAPDTFNYGSFTRLGPRNSVAFIGPVEVET